MVMEGSDVVGVTSGTKEVIGGATEVGLDVGTGGTISIGSSPCSGCGGIGGATMGGTPGSAE